MCSNKAHFSNHKLFLVSWAYMRRMAVSALVNITGQAFICTNTVLTFDHTQYNTIWYYIMAGHAIVVFKDTNLLFYHGNAVILTLW